MQALSEGALPLSVVAKEFSHVMLDAACTVLGVSGRAKAVVQGPCGKAVVYGVQGRDHQGSQGRSVRWADINDAQAARRVLNANIWRP